MQLGNGRVQVFMCLVCTYCIRVEYSDIGSGWKVGLSVHTVATTITTTMVSLMESCCLDCSVY